MSFRTTTFGPHLSVQSSGQQPSGDEVGAFKIGVPIILNGPNLTATDPDTTLLQDGQLSITSLSDVSCVLAIRSGNSVYVFANTAVE